MNSQQKNVNEQMIDRIDAVLDRDLPRYDRYGMDDRSVLTYLRGKLTAEAIQERVDSQFDSGDVGHLREVAKQRLAPYENEKESVSLDD